MAGYSGWGAAGLSNIFSEQDLETEPERHELKELLTDEEYRAAARGTNYAHYTDPAYVTSIWEALKEYGFESGRVLEPGSGIGNFIGLAPPKAQVTGIEVDPIAAQLSQAIYPESTIRAESFTESPIPNGYFDATIGNVPFSPVHLHDPRHNPQGHSMHNYFILKSINLTKPGGIVAVLTSTSTLDSKNSDARQDMYQKADLLGAYRLPEGAFSNAGTQVMTDLLVFRVREEGKEPLNNAWVTASERTDTSTNETYHRNDYFDANPQNLLGETYLTHNRFGALTEALKADMYTHENLPRILSKALTADATRAIEQGYGHSPIAVEVKPLPLLLPDTRLADGHIIDQGQGNFSTYRSYEDPEELKVPKTQAKELSHLLSLRDQARALLQAEALHEQDTPQIVKARAELKATYEDYLQTYGHLNRVTISETEDGGITRRYPPVMGKFKKDPYQGLVLALEIYSEATQSAVPAAILERRVLEPRKPVTQVDNAADALTVSLDQRGAVDLPFMAQLMKTSQEEIITELKDRIYPLPYQLGETPSYVTREEYLSGNVRKKLEAALSAAETNPALTDNVVALKNVMPADIPAADIRASLGAAWISDEIHQQFAREVIGVPTAKVMRVHGSQWSITGPKYYDPNNMGTDRRPPLDLLAAIIRQEEVVITTDKKFDPEATAIAHQKMEMMREKFDQWIWSDPQRTAELVRTYNEVNNSLVLRDYTAAGQALTLPGLVSSFTPHPHQRTAIARMIHEPSVGLFHGVGAGKTAEMVIGATELKRLGLINKPAAVVPNHMLQQFAHEWLALYPQARILAASASDIGSGEKRRKFIARVATTDWDAVIITHQALKNLELGPDAQSRYIEREIEIFRDSLEKYHERAGDSADRIAVKKLEERIEQREQKLNALLDVPRDPGLTFEETGIDYLCVDELHEFKNLETVSSIKTASINGSQQASHLHSLIEYLRETNGNRVVTGATGTPIANSMSEMHVMARYLAPELLREQGVEDFDSWAATFGKTVTEMELTVAGGDSYHSKTRFSQFVNIPELVQTFHTFGDVKLASDMQGLTLPDVKTRDDGKRAPEILLLERSETQVEYIKTLGQRYEAVRGTRATKGADNPMVIASDGRKAAADMRLIDTAYNPLPGEQTKVSRTADLLAEVYEENKDRTYMIPKTGQPHPVPGALQIVFADLGVPSKVNKDFNLYDELKAQCVERGIPAQQIRYIHDAKSDAQKQKLFNECRNGEVSVLIGSTKKMGVGTNVQDRLVHLVHLDAPWRPADVEQRNGRIIRQGNQNPEVRITQVVTKGTFDANMWATLDRKEKFISQIMKAQSTARVVEDLGDAQPTYAEVQAVATGNPYIIEHHAATERVKGLEAALRGYNRDRDYQLFSLEALTQRTESLEKDWATSQEQGLKFTTTAGDAFTMNVAGSHFDKRMEAVEAMQQWAKENVPMRPSFRGAQDLGVLGTLGGVSWSVNLSKVNASQVGETAVSIAVAALPWMKVETNFAELSKPTRGLLTRMENLVNGSDQWMARLETEIRENQQKIEQLQKKVDQPFERQAQLEAARVEERRLGELVQKFKEATTEEEKTKIMETERQTQVDIVASYQEPQSEPQKDVQVLDTGEELARLQEQHEQRVQVLREQVEQDFAPVLEAKERLSQAQTPQERSAARAELHQAEEVFRGQYPDATGVEYAHTQLVDKDPQAVELAEKIKQQGGEVASVQNTQKQMGQLEQERGVLEKQRDELKNEIEAAKRDESDALSALKVHQGQEELLKAEQQAYLQRLLDPIRQEYALVEEARQQESAGSTWWGISKDSEAEQRMQDFSAKYGGAQNMADIQDRWVPNDPGVRDYEQRLNHLGEKVSRARGDFEGASSRREQASAQLQAVRADLQKNLAQREQVDPSLRAARIARNGISEPGRSNGIEPQRHRGLER